MPTKPMSGPFASTEAILDVLEEAFEHEWQEDGDPSELPSHLQDALAVRERGLALLRKGLQLSDDGVCRASETADEEYRAAARHGKRIPEAVLERMHKERENVEREVLKE